MKTINCSWEEFKGSVERTKINSQGNLTSKGINLPILFRGQSNSKWNLESSLSRLKPNITFTEYKDIIAKVFNESKDVSFAKWDITEQDIIDCKWTYCDEVESNIFDYIIYLRHQEFPTPILDWSRNYLVSAFFAFENELSEDPVAIFSYVETSCAAKGYALGNICIKLKNNSSKAHPRHIKQDACYTVCHEMKNNELIFPPHYKFFNSYNIYYKEMSNQDIYYKFLIPSSEREIILKELNQKGINRKTLYSNTDVNCINKDKHYQQLKNKYFNSLENKK